MANPVTHSELTNPPRILYQESPLLQMPQDILTQILTQLPEQGIGATALVCRQLNQGLKDDDVWRILFYHRFPCINPGSIENFESAYQDLHSNLTKGVYASHTLTGHGSPVSCIAVFDGKLFSGSWDKTIKVWDLQTEECTATLRGHGDAVSFLTASDGKLFSASIDCTIKVWDLKTEQCKATLSGHSQGVYSLAVVDGKLFSASTDDSMKVWDLKTGECIETLIGQGNWVGPVALVDGKLFASSSNNTIKVWDLKTRQWTETLTGPDSLVCSVALLDDKLFLGCSNGTIQVWDLKTGHCKEKLIGHGAGVCSLAVFDEKLFSGSADCTIKVWDLKTGECTATLTGHGNGVWSLATFNGKLFSGSDDKTIKSWDFTAHDTTIFQEIAQLLEIETLDVAHALERFSRMPKTPKKAIYGKLYEILKPLANHYSEYAEHAFHNQNEQSSTAAEKAQAIREYLNDQAPKNNSQLLPGLGITNAQPPKNNSQLLAGLGIKTEEEYSEKLKCRSEYLEKIGIFSAGDLKLICSASSQFLKLGSLEVLEVEGDFRDNKVKIEADRRKSNLTMLTEQISQIVENKIEETNICPVILYEAECPWSSFQQKVKTFQAKLSEIGDKSNTAQSMVEGFNSKNYNRLASELNALVEEFHTLDRDHQISKLHAYVNQWGILGAWNNLRSQGVQNLSGLPESKRSSQKLFRMGE